jgi:phosphatidate cytidylyltransferase
MAKRILSTCLLWTLVILCLRYLGPTGAVWLVTAIAVLTLREFYLLLHRMGLEPFDRFGMGAALVITPAPLYLEQLGLGPSVLVGLAVIVFAIRILGERQPQNRTETLAWTLFGVIYVPFMLHFLVRVILIDQPLPRTGLWLVVWLIAVSKFCDVGALLTGMACGRHKLAPEISPKKTWEGAVGGIIVSAMVGAGLVWGFGEPFPARFTPLLAALVAVPIAALAIVSDLVESIIKRRADAKDTGQTIPGIGGVFDLSDSLILTAPLGYLVFVLLG